MRLAQYPYKQARHYTRGRTLAGKPAPLDTIVIHWTAGPGDTDAVAAYFQTDRKASYHFAIGRDGRVLQLVDTADTAWHAGDGTLWDGARPNPRSIGVALCNLGPVTPAWIGKHGAERALAGPHHKPGFGAWRSFERYTGAQDRALADLLAALCEQHSGLRYVTGHEDLTRGKGDPGPALYMLRTPWPAHLEIKRRDWTANAWRTVPASTLLQLQASADHEGDTGGNTGAPPLAA